MFDYGSLTFINSNFIESLCISDLRFACVSSIGSDVWVGLVVGNGLSLVAPLHSTKKAVEENSEREVGGKEGERIESNFLEFFLHSLVETKLLGRCNNQNSWAQLTPPQHVGPNLVSYYISTLLLKKNEVKRN